MRALLSQQDRLGARSVEQRLLLSYVQAGGNAALLPVFDELQAFFERGDAAVQHGDLRIQLAQREVVRAHFRRDGEPHIG